MKTLWRPWKNPAARFSSGAARHRCVEDTVDTPLRDGSRVKVGKLEIAVLHSHGHSPDSICLFTSFGPHRILFSGDTVFAEGGHGTVTADTDFKKYRASVKRLVQWDNATALLPGHRQFVLADGNEHVKLLDKKMSGRWTDVVATRVRFSRRGGSSTIPPFTTTPGKALRRWTPDLLASKSSKHEKDYCMKPKVGLVGLGNAGRLLRPRLRVSSR